MASVTADPARELTIYFRINRDGRLILYFLDENGDPFDLTDYGAVVNFKSRKDASDNILQLTDGDGLTIEPTDGTIELAVTKAQANQFREQTYFWEMVITDPDSLEADWLTGDAIYHNGKFDGVATSLETITVNAGADTVQITVSAGGASSAEVDAASQPEVEAGTVTDKYVSPKTLNDWTKNLGQYVSLPEYFGAVGDGITDDQAAIQAAINTGLPVLISQIYLVGAPIVMATEGQMIYGNGTIKTNSNISIISIQTKKVNIQDINLEANNSGATQYGISIIGNVGLTLDYTSNRITNVNFKNFGNSGKSAGIYIYRVTGTGGTTHQGAAYVVNCFFDHCNVGVYLDDRAEFNCFVNCSVYNSTTGAYFVGGIPSWIGGHITDSAIGFEFAHGTNDAHGVIMGVVVGHNGNTAVKATSINVWQSFVGCFFSSTANVTLVSCTGFKFIDCEFYSETITLTNCTQTEFINNRFGDTPTITLTGTNARWFNNFFMAGTIPSQCVNTLDNLILPSYTVATLPSASTYVSGFIYVSNETGGPTMAFSDGTNWRRVQDRNVVS